MPDFAPSRSGEAPFVVDAFVVEDDTYTVLSANPEFRPPGMSVSEATAAADASGDDAHPLGSVVVRGARPLILHAIVHDLSAEPTCSEGSIRAALDAAFAEAERRKLTAIAMMPIGTRFGSIDEPRFVELLHASLRAARVQSVAQVWIIATGQAL